MANAYSINTANNEYITPVNIPLLNTVMASKQQKYDANLAKIDSVIETYTKADLLRSKDKKILYDNINTVLNSVNNIDKLDLSNNSVVRDIENSFRGAVTPYLAQQIENTAKVRSFLTEVSKKKEKNPDLYSSTNLEYALNNAGYYDYMDESKGKDSLGALTYTDYVDQNKVIMDALQPWAKEYGYEMSYGEVAGSNPAYFIEETRKRLGSDKVDSFVTNLINNDPKLKNQVLINSWNNYRGLSDEEFDKNYKSIAKENEDSDTATIVKIDEEQKKYVQNSQEWVALQGQKDVLTKRRDNFKAIADSTTPVNRRGAEFNMYVKGLSQSFSNTYAYDRIDSRKYNDMPLKIAKELRDQEKHEWERMERQGFNVNGTMAGYETQVNTEANIPETGKTKYQEAFESYDTGFEVVRQKWSAIDPSFARKTKEQQDSIIRASLDSDEDAVKIDGRSGSTYAIPTSIASDINKLKIDSTAINEYSKNAVNNLEKISEEVYNGFLDSFKNRTDFNLDRFRGTPALKEFIKSGKSYKSLSNKEKLEVQYELSDRLKLDFGDDALVRENYNVANKEIKSRLDALGGYKRQRDLGIGGAQNVPLALTSASASTISNIFSGVAEGFGDLYTRFVEGEEALDRRLASRSSSNNTGAYLRGAVSGIQDLFTEDEDFNSLGLRDVNFNGQNASQYLRGIHEGLKRGQENTMANVLPTLTTNTKITFNKDNKSDKPYITDLTSILQARTGKIVSNTAPLSISSQGGNYIIEGTVETQEQNEKGTFKKVYTPVRETIPATEATSLIRSRLNAGTDDFTYSIRNKNRKPIVARVTLPNSPDKKEDLIKSLYSDFEKNMDANRAIEVTGMINSKLKTPSERITDNEILIKTSTQRNMLNNLYNSDFKVTFVGSIEQGFVPTLVATDSQGNVKSKTYPAISDVRSSEIKMITSSTLIDQFIKEQEGIILTRR